MQLGVFKLRRDKLDREFKSLQIDLMLREAREQRKIRGCIKKIK